MRRGREALALLLTIGVSACGVGVPEPVHGPLLLEVPLEQIDSDLRSFVPGALRSTGVPGLSAALVRGGRVVLNRAFGVRSTLTGEPVRPDSLFQVASISKVVTSIAALRLVEDHRLRLDAPLADRVPDPVVDASPYRDQVTLRRILSHTSGMSNLWVGVRRDTRIHFPPGDRFSYSGQGFQYLERGIEAASGRSFAEAVGDEVLRPLGLRDVRYRLDRGARARVARPHVPAGIVLAGFAALWLVCGAIVWGASRIARAFRPTPPPSSRLFGRARLAGGAAAAIVILAGLGHGDPTGVAGLVAALSLGALCVEGIVWALGGTGRRRARAVGAVVCLLALVWVASRPAIPLPAPEIGIRAAGGLYATAPDVGRILGEILSPDRLDPKLLSILRRPNTRISETLSWGLGIGIQHGPSGDSVWHWGMNPGAESLVVGVPEHGLGVVVLTNGGPPGAGLGLAREVAIRAIGGDHGGYWTEVPGTAGPAPARESPEG